MINNPFHKLDFLHVPKAAGTSIRLAITSNIFRKLFIKYHGHEVCFADLVTNSNCKSIRGALLVLRNPFSWYKSIYNFKMNSNIKDKIKIYPKMPNNSWNDFFQDCVLIDNGLDGIKKWFRPWENYHNRIFERLNISEGIYSAFYRFYSSIDILGYKKIKSGIYYYNLEIIRIENLEEDLNNTIKKYHKSIPYIKLGIENKSMKSRFGYAEMTNDQIKIIKLRDSNIYRILNSFFINKK